MSQSLSAKQRREYKELFNMLDKDKDGKLNKDDLETIMTELGMKPTTRIIRDMIEECDPSGTGSITFANFISVLSGKLRNTSRSEHLLEAFELLDESKSGSIPSLELKKHLTKWGTPLTTKEWRAMLAEVNCAEGSSFNYRKFVASMTNTSQNE